MIFSKIANYYISRRNAAIEQSRHGRIAYIDLIKGILIISVIYRHSVAHAYGTGLFNNMVAGIKMASFMCISFLFFKEYSGFVDFSIRKFCKLMIPFTLATICDMIIYVVTHWGESLLNPLYFQIFQTAYLPTWFLYVLFLCYIEYYIYRSTTSRFPFMTRLLIAVGISLLSYYGLIYWRFTHLLSLLLNSDFINCYALRFLYIPFLILPLFVLMEQIQKLYLLHKEISATKIFIVCIIALSCWRAFSQRGISIFNLAVGRIPIYQIEVLALTIILLCIGRAIKWLPVISYMGRYSIIVFIVHSLFMSVKITSSLDISCITQPFEFFLINCIVSLLAIPIFRKYLPYLCAQKDLLVLGADNHMHLAPEVKSWVNHIFRKNSSK